MSVRCLRLAAVLLPAALLLHEGAYALTGDGDRASHSYLELALPALFALAASLAVASLLLPLLGGGPRRAGTAPLALACGMVAIFLGQELAEALLLGGGVAELAEALAAAWLLVPLALLLAALATAGLGWLDRTGERLLAAVRSRAPRLTGAAGRVSAAIRARDPLALSSLAFGLARRPPPTRSSVA